jgi:hypothetical protein
MSNRAFTLEDLVGLGLVERDDPMAAFLVELANSSPIRPDPIHRDRHLVRPWYEYSQPTVGHLIRQTLLATGWSQRQLAINIGIHFVTLNRIVRGSPGRLNPSQRERLENICRDYPGLEAMYRTVDWKEI